MKGLASCCMYFKKSLDFQKILMYNNHEVAEAYVFQQKIVVKIK